MKHLFYCLLVAGALCAPRASAGFNLEEGFQHPPDSTRPWCYWYWISDQISREGITRDLESMKRVGIGEAFIGNIFLDDTKPGMVKVLTPEWWGMVEHAIREGGRLGVDIGMFNCPGWSQSGGPWIQSTNSMRRISCVEKRVAGPGRVDLELKAPSENFQPLGLIAFPAPLEDGSGLTTKNSTLTCSPGLDHPERILDGDPSTVVSLPTGHDQYAFDFATLKPMTIRSIVIEPAKTDFSMKCELWVEEGGKFRSLRSFIVDRSNNSIGVGFMPHGAVAISLEPATGSRFRLVCNSLQGRPGIADVRLSGAARMERYVEKQLGKMHPTPLPNWDTYLWNTPPEPGAPGLAVSPRSVIDLAGKLSADGKLSWEVPAGEWVVLWTGLVPTGTRNAPASPEGQGLEVDKMNRTALRDHFKAFIGQLLERMKPEDRKALKHVVADSYEMGAQNWTDGFAGRFEKRYGYDPRPWLPVMTGRLVGSSDESERFLWDLRRLVADLVATEYVGGLREACAKNGLKLWLENYGHWGFPAEFLQYGGQADEVSGEFWATGDLGSIELRCASSAAHTYGKPVVHAEAFTSSVQFESTPWSLKKRGDWGLTEGINHWVLHVYIHQPWEDRVPGVNAWFSTEFNRHNTWFEQGRAWIDYYRRCCFLLQQGRPVADIAYFIGEDAPKMTGVRNPALPAGYNFDYINAEVIESRLKVRDGRFTLPDGVSYSLLVLPDLKTMRPGLAKKLRDLVHDGGTIVGSAPERSPSREGFPQCDKEVRKIAGEIWGGSPESTGTSPSKAFGRGRVFLPGDLEPVLKSMGVGPDVSGVNSKKVLWTHRASADTDIYFLSNQSEQDLSISPVFRVRGRSVELWNAVRGGISPAPFFEGTPEGTRVGLQLASRESVFVVFRGTARPDLAVRELRLDGKLVRSLDGAAVSEGRPLAGEDQVNTFTMAGWVNPRAKIGMPGEADDGVFLHVPRNEAVVAAHGASLSDEPGHVGAGISIGTNGVCVFEHGASYFAPILASETPLSGWQFIAVVYDAGRPALHINGKLVHQGLQSKKKVHSGAAMGSATSGFAGQTGGFQTYAGALKEVDLLTLFQSGPPTRSPTTLPIVLGRKNAGGLEAEVSANGRFEVVWGNGRVSQLAISNVAAPLELSGAWEVEFPQGRGVPPKVTLDRLIPLETHPNPSIQYFSGTARYARKVELPMSMLESGRRINLDLGEVNSIAEVWLNGKPLGTFWGPPYILDITSAAHAGLNELVVAVTGTWRNRLIGEAKFHGSLPAGAESGQKFTPYLSTNIKLNGAEALLPSGLVGPVRLIGSVVSDLAPR